jgi:hypothetical protein
VMPPTRAYEVMTRPLGFELVKKRPVVMMSAWIWVTGASSLHAKSRCFRRFGHESVRICLGVLKI